MFELKVVSNTPLSAETNLDIVLETFLIQIGYITKNYDPKTTADNLRDSIPYLLFKNYFVRSPEKAWTVEELSAHLKTTKPTIYRHINKLKSIDILESVEVEYEGSLKKGYRIRYGNLSKAWNFTEANVSMAMENYKKTIDHIQSLVETRE